MSENDPTEKMSFIQSVGKMAHRLGSTKGAGEVPKLLTDTLVKLREQVEDCIDSLQCDVDLDDDVLKIHLKDRGGKDESGKTFVINRHTASRQIWYSSPVSGPDKFQYAHGDWTSVKNKSKFLHNVLETDLKKVLDKNIKIRI